MWRTNLFWTYYLLIHMLNEIGEGRAPEDHLRMLTVPPVDFQHICPVLLLSLGVSTLLMKAQPGRMQLQHLLEVNSWIYIGSHDLKSLYLRHLFYFISEYFLSKFSCKKMHFPFTSSHLISFKGTTYYCWTSHDPSPSASKQLLPANTVSFHNKTLAGLKATLSGSNSLKYHISIALPPFN